MEAALASPETARVMADINLVTAVEPQRSLAISLSGVTTTAVKPAKDQ